MVSPAATGELISPERILAMLKIATFTVAGPLQTISILATVEKPVKPRAHSQKDHGRYSACPDGRRRRRRAYRRHRVRAARRRGRTHRATAGLRRARRRARPAGECAACL